MIRRGRGAPWWPAALLLLLAVARAGAGEVVRERLPNGLVVLVHPEPGQLVSMGMWVRTGAALERPPGRGISHLLEHLLFKGKDVARRARALGGRLNAFTSFEWTAFELELPAARLREGMEVLRELVFSLRASPEDFAREREVVLREVDMNRDDPERRFHRLLWEVGFRRHPYAEPILGHVPALRALRLADLRRYWEARYVPRNAVLSVAGPLSPRAVVRAATSVFGSLPDRLPSVPVLPPAPSPWGPLRRVAEGPCEAARLGLAFRIPPALAPEAAPLDVLAAILGEGRCSRLFELRRRGLVQEVGAWTQALSRGGLLVIEALVRPESLSRAERAIHRELRRLRAEGVRPWEVRRARSLLRSELLRSLTTPGGWERQMALGELLYGDPQFWRRYLERLERVRPQDVQRAARRFLRRERLCTLVLRPRGASPEAPCPAPARGLPRVSRHRLRNGVRLLVERDPGCPLVFLRAVLRGGSAWEDRCGAAQLLARLLVEGTRRLSPRELWRRLEERGIRLWASAGRDAFVVGMDLPPAEFEEAVRVLAQVLFEPRLDERALERERRLLLAEIRRQREDPFRVAALQLRRALWPAHPYGRPLLGEEAAVRSLRREDLRRLHRRLFAPQRLVVAAFGGVPREGVSCLRRHLEAVRPGPGLPPLPPAGAPRPRRVRGELPGRRQAVAMVGFRVPGLRSPERPALRLLATVLGGQDGLVFTRVREERGLSYVAGASLALGLRGGMLVAYLATKPSRLGEALQRLRLALQGVQGLDPGAWEAARRDAVGCWMRALQDPGDRAELAARWEALGLGWEGLWEEGRRLEAVTLQQVKSLARRLLDPDRAVTSLVVPAPAAGTRRARPASEAATPAVGTGTCAGR